MEPYTSPPLHICRKINVDAGTFPIHKRLFDCMCNPKYVGPFAYYDPQGKQVGYYAQSVAVQFYLPKAMNTDQDMVKERTTIVPHLR